LSTQEIKSIISTEKKCVMCGSVVWLERHHIFNNAYRDLSEQYGLVVWLCHYCHNEPPNGVHFNKVNMHKLKALGQKAFNEHYPNLNFMDIFKRNYL